MKFITIFSLSNILEVDDFILQFSKFGLCDFVVVDFSLISTVNLKIKKIILFLKLFSILCNACLNPSSNLYFTTIMKINLYLLLREELLMRVGHFLQDLLLLTFVIRFLGLEVLALTLDFQQVVVLCTFLTF